MQKFGITDAKSYFRKLRIPIAICVIVCACIGASQSGFGGFIAGTLVGLIAPVALMWLGVILIAIALYMAVYFIAMAVVLYFLWWFASKMFFG